MSLVLAFGFAVRWEAYPFLAVNQPVNGEILIVEGWIGTEVLNQAAAEFARGKYRKLLVARPVYDNGRTYLHGRVSDDYFLLIKNGVPRESLDTVFYLASQRDRTYHSALAVKAWFVENGAFPKSFNVATMGAHARRSWLLYQEAFGNTAEIGVVALEDQTFDPKHWWRSSEGVRETLGETIAYVYAKFFFGWTQQPPTSGGN